MATDNRLVYNIIFQTADKASAAIKYLGQELGNVERSANAVSASIGTFSSKFSAASVASVNKAKEMSAAIDGVRSKLAMPSAANNVAAIGTKAFDSAQKFTSLNMSVQQVARELPSLAMGANMFFLAISNNLPILGDSIKKARIENKALIASGQEFTPVWKQVTGSIFSWTTAMVVGITILSAYGSQIIGAISGMIKSTSANDAARKAQESLNEALKKGTEDAQKDIIHLRLLYTASQDHTKSISDRKAAIKSLKDEYPSYFKNMSDESIIAGKAKEAYDNLAKSIVKVAQARAIEEKLVENEKKALDNESKMAAMQQKYNESKKALSQVKPINAYQPGGIYEIQNMGSSLKIYQEYTDLAKKTKELREENERLSKSIDIKGLTDNPKEKTGNKTKEVNNLATTGGIENKIKDLQQKQSKAMADEAIALEKQIELWQKKLDIMRNAITIGAAEKPVLQEINVPKKGLDVLNPKTDKYGSTIPIAIELDNKSFSKVENVLMQRLAAMKKDVTITSEQMTSMLADGITSMLSGLGEGIGNGDWGKALQSMLIGAIDMLKQFATTLIAAGTAMLAFEALLWNPILAIVAGGALLVATSAAEAAISKTSRFAAGGIVSGPTLALVGEYSGASNNPEVIAPLNKLQSMIRPQQSFDGLQLETKVRGKDLYIALRSVEYENKRTR